MYGVLEALTPDDVEAIAAYAVIDMLEAGITAVAAFHCLRHDRRGEPFGDLAEMSSRIAAATVSHGNRVQDRTVGPVMRPQGGWKQSWHPQARHRSGRYKRRIPATILLSLKCSSGGSERIGNCDPTGNRHASSSE